MMRPLPALLLFHIAAAIVGVFSGMVAISLRKGSFWHRRLGTVFAVSMLSMALSAVYLAVAKAQTLNALEGALTAYMVATSWTAARRRDDKARWADAVALLVALGLGIIFITDGIAGIRAPTPPPESEAIAG